MARPRRESPVWGLSWASWPPSRPPTGGRALIAALERAVAFGRWRAGDVRSILAAGTGTPRPTGPGEALLIPLPIVPTRPLTDYAIGEPR